MNIAYITRARMPTEKAHGLQIAKMCEAYSKLGHNVELYVPYRKNKISESISEYYNLGVDIPVHKTATKDITGLSRWFPRTVFWLQALLFLLGMGKYHIDKRTLIITRSPEVAWWYARKGYNTIYEVHDIARSGKIFFKYFLKNVMLLVCNSKGTSRSLRKMGLPQTFVAPNGVGINALQPTIQRAEMCKRNGIDPQKFIVMYIGALDDWKGYKTLLEASKELKEKQVVIVGGSEKQIQGLRAQYPNVKFLGTKPYKELGNYQNMANVLIIPNDPKYAKEQEYTSPIKLFAHLSSGVPIVVTDLPTIRDIVDETSVFFFDGSVSTLVAIIKQIKSSREDVKKKTECALVVAKKHSWISRASNILLKII